MEGVGARLGRSSSRYGTTTVFTGPVRRWKKKWVNVPPSNSNQQHHHKASNGAINESNASSRLSLFKWIPTAPSQNKDDDNDYGITDASAGSKNSDKDEAVAAEEPPKKKFKYIPIIALEEQNNESSEQNEDEARPIKIDEKDTEANSKSDGFNGKPEIIDLPVEEDSENDDLERQNLNESTFDLNLGFKARDGENKSDPKADQDEDEQSE